MAFLYTWKNDRLLEKNWEFKKLTSLWEDLKKSNPEEFSVTLQEIALWHQNEALLSFRKKRLLDNYTQAELKGIAFQLNLALSYYPEDEVLIHMDLMLKQHRESLKQRTVVNP